MSDFSNLPEKETIKRVYSDYRIIFERILLNIQTRLKSEIQLNPSPVFKARIKSFPSYYKKLLRLKPSEASSKKTIVPLTDMMGIRVVCAFLEDVSVVEEQVKEIYSVREVEYKGATQSVKEFGYESTHILIEIPSDCIPDDPDFVELLKANPLPEGLVCEIQIRTILQDAWAEVEHELIYKTEFTPFDMPLRRKMASINASLSLADIIFQEIRDYQKNLQQEVEERRDSFYEKADFITNKENKLLSIDAKKKNMINKASPYVHGTIDDLILEALRAHNNGDLEEAIDIYTTILSSEQKLNENVYAVIYKHRGMAYFAQNQYQSALDDFEKSASYGTSNFRAIYYQGIVYSVMNDDDKAIECFTKSIDLNGFQSHAFFRRALSYYNKEDYNSALADLNSAEKLGLDSDECKSFHAKLLKKFDMGM